MWFNVLQLSILKQDVNEICPCRIRASFLRLTRCWIPWQDRRPSSQRPPYITDKLPSLWMLSVCGRSSQSQSVSSSLLLLRLCSLLRFEILWEECERDGVGTLIASKSLSSAILYNFINTIIYSEYWLSVINVPAEFVCTPCNYKHNSIYFIDTN